MSLQYPLPQKAIAIFEDKIELNDKFVHYMFEMKTPHDLPFLSGQYVSIKVSDKGERRAYSICSTPAITHGFELLLDITPAGVGTQFLQNLKFGQEIEVMGPLGRFVINDLDLQTEPTLVFVATGSGIAPLYSMIVDLLQVRKESRPMVLYWGLRHESELFWEMDLHHLTELYANFSFHPVISKPGNGWTLCTGRVTDCMHAHGVFNPAGYYLCGGKAMIEDMTSILTGAGITSDHIHHEKFF